MANPNEGSSAPFNQGDETAAQDALLQQITSLIDSAMARNREHIERMVEDKLSNRGPGQHGHQHQIPGGDNRHTDDETSRKAVDRTTFKAFKGCGATDFKGTETPIAACSWIENIRKVFAISRCEEEDKVLFASAMLTEDALHWWNARVGSLGEIRVKLMLWSEFEDEFMRQFCPADQQEKYEREFMELQQGNMTVAAYEAEFNRKSQFAAELLSSEAVKVRRFVQGLRWEVKEAVQMQSLSSLADATRYARMREDILKARDTELMPPPKRTHTEVPSSAPSSFFSSGRSPTVSRSSFRGRTQSV